jgi:hypothetical protein
LRSLGCILPSLRVTPLFAHQVDFARA